ncbi:33686_t:CDS:1, partial [Racocetra persica]
ETEHKNKIKKARAHGITPSPKRKNVIPPTSRFKKTTVQLSVTNSDIAETNDEIVTLSVASNENDSPRHNSITTTNFDDSESPTITPHTTKSSRPSKIPI